MPYTYRDLIRFYSRDVENGSADTDLMPRERRLTSVMLNLASNANSADTAYPPSGGARACVVAALANIAWDARPLVIAAARDAGRTAFEVAITRAIDILNAI